MPAGRPPKYSTPEEMQKLIDKYFKDCEGETLKDPDGKIILDKYDRPIMIGQKPPTVTGLCLALNLLSRDALLNYQGKSEFHDTVTRAKMRCQEYAESRLYDKDGANGAKFSLSNNFGWIERQEVTNINDNLLLETPQERRARIAELLSRKEIEGAIDADYQVINEGENVLQETTVLKDTDKPKE